MADQEPPIFNIPSEPGINNKVENSDMPTCKHTGIGYGESISGAHCGDCDVCWTHGGNFIADGDDVNTSFLSKESVELCEEGTFKIDSEDDIPSDFPEGGWGWVVVVAAFFNSFIFDGIASSFGVLYPYVLSKFNASAFLTSFAGSMFAAYLIMGSVAAFLMKRFGFRVVSVAGGLLCCVGFIAASFSQNIYLFLFSFGIVGGIGAGCVYLPSMVIVNGYFNKKRGITNGIISSGSGVGLLVMAPVTNALLDRYSLNGTILLLAGVLLNICVFSSCFRKPKLYQVYCSENNETDSMNAESCCEEDTSEEIIENNCEHEPKRLETAPDPTIGDDKEIIREITGLSSSNAEPYPQLVVTDMDERDEGTKLEKSLLKHRNKDKFLFHELRSNHSLVTKLPSADKSFKHSLNLLPKCRRTDRNSARHANVLRNSYKGLQSTHLSGGLKVYCVNNEKVRCVNQRHKQHTHHTSSVFTDIGTNSYLSASISKLMHIHNQQFASAHQLDSVTSKPYCQSMLTIPVNNDKISFKNNLHLPKQFTSSEHSLQSHSLQNQSPFPTQEDKSLPAEPFQIQRKPLGYSIGELLRTASFHLFCLGACLIQFGYPIPGIFLADLAAVHGISAQSAAIIISLIGSSNLVGRFLAGVLANLNFNPLRLTNLAMLVAAILCFLCPVFTSMWSLCLFASLYGFLLGFFPPLQPLIIVQYFGIGSLASTFGFVTTLKGCAGLIGPPLAGWIYDKSHDYSISIASAGVAFILSVIVNEALVCTIRRKIK